MHVQERGVVIVIGYDDGCIRTHKRVAVAIEQLAEDAGTTLVAATQDGIEADIMGLAADSYRWRGKNGALVGIRGGVIDRHELYEFFDVVVIATGDDQGGGGDSHRGQDGQADALHFHCMLPSSVETIRVHLVRQRLRADVVFMTPSETTGLRDASGLASLSRSMQ